MTPLEKLCLIPDTQGRIDAVAADLAKKRRQFSKIDSWNLAYTLSLQLDGPANCMKVTPKCSLDDAGEEFPAWENLELLEGRIPAARYAQLQTQGQEIEDGIRSSNITIEPEERQLIDVALHHDFAPSGFIDFADFAFGGPGAAFADKARNGVIETRQDLAHGGAAHGVDGLLGLFLQLQQATAAGAGGQGDADRNRSVGLAEDDRFHPQSIPALPRFDQPWFI
jgi:hypothetical protein